MNYWQIGSTHLFPDKIYLGCENHSQGKRTQKKGNVTLITTDQGAIAIYNPLVYLWNGKPYVIATIVDY